MPKIRRATTRRRHPSRAGTVTLGTRRAHGQKAATQGGSVCPYTTRTSRTLPGRMQMQVCSSSFFFGFPPSPRRHQAPLYIYPRANPFACPVHYFSLTRLTYSPIPQELANRKLSWFHKRNFTLHLVNNGPSTPAQFPENAFASGTLVAGDYPPATTVVGNAAWIMCAVSLRGQERFKWTVNADGSRRHNGYCWDGQSQTAAWGGAGNFQRLRYFS